MNQRLGVTDHALIRYLERVGGFEIEALRRDIAHRLQPASDAGAASVVIDGHVYLIGRADPRGPSVVTVLPVSMSLRRTLR
ncbi:hypothetical protein [Paracoccus sp. ME4]|uniref:hypothetical protein n=1 Tax=Paracoccus sp. ME4 TaxID=3138066 RepID=UPI00398B76F4